MGSSTRTETERKLRRMARGYVDMKYGTYQWPEGQAALDPSGAPRISRAELLRYAGYSANYKMRGRPLFEDPYFKKQVALEFARREQAFQLSAPSVNQMLLTGSALMAEIHVRASEDIGSFSTAQLLQYGPTIYKMGLEIEARLKSEEKKNAPPDPNDVRATFARGIMLSPEQRSELEEGLINAADERREAISLLVDAATALDESDDTP